MARTPNADTRPPVKWGDRVTVREQGIRDYSGIATSVKFSSLSGWYVDVRFEDDGLTRTVHASAVFPIKEKKS